MAVVGDFIGQIGQLRFQGRLRAVDEALGHGPQFARMRQRAVFQNAFARLEHQVQAVKGAVVLFQRIDHAQALQVVLEAAVRLHALIEHVLAHVAEWRVAQVMRQGDGFHQIFIQAQVARDGAAHLRHFQAVRQARAEQVSLVIEENLGLVFEAAEGRGMDDAVAVALELAARGVRRLGKATSLSLRRMGRIGGQEVFGQHLIALRRPAWPAPVRAAPT